MRKVLAALLVLFILFAFPVGAARVGPNTFSVDYATDCSWGIADTNPVTAERRLMGYTNKPIAFLTGFNRYVVDGTAPSAEFNIGWSSTPLAATQGTIFASNRTATSTSGAAAGGVVNTIPTGKWFYLEYGTVAGGTTDFAIFLCAYQ